MFGGFILFCLAREVSVNAGGNMMMLWLTKKKWVSYVTVASSLIQDRLHDLPLLVLVFSE